VSNNSNRAKKNSNSDKNNTLNQIEANKGPGNQPISINASVGGQELQSIVDFNNDEFKVPAPLIAG
jgi:hypothetical protein